MIVVGSSGGGGDDCGIVVVVGGGHVKMGQNDFYEIERYLWSCCEARDCVIPICVER